ncbi:hypothetical protein [Bradyrhizobium sp. LjRoot220]|uniref:hypothetical protein n=1 Tax=Bradyrhizobium sp. LjRoot220 TaxID=3342284 RepID=UPI003F4F6B72
MMLVQENGQAVPDGFVIRHRGLKQGLLYIPRQIRPELEGGAAQQFHELAGSIVHFSTFEPFAVFMLRNERAMPGNAPARVTIAKPSS